MFFIAYVFISPQQLTDYGHAHNWAMIDSAANPACIP
jgi:hypothetical protein